MQEIARLVEARHWDPFSVLGPHVVPLRTGKAVAIRAILPDAARASVVTLRDGEEVRAEMERLHPDGLFQGRLRARALAAQFEDGIFEQLLIDLFLEL